MSPSPFPLYIKKEDARDVVDMRRKNIMIMFAAESLIFVMLRFSVIPNLLSLYESMHIVPSLLMSSSKIVSLAIAVGCMLYSLALFTTKPDYTEVDSEASKYKDGEMIKINKLVDSSYIIKHLLAFSACIAYIVVAIILPIYSIIP